MVPAVPECISHSSTLWFLCCFSASLVILSFFLWFITEETRIKMVNYLSYPVLAYISISIILGMKPWTVSFLSRLETVLFKSRNLSLFQARIPHSWLKIYKCSLKNKLNHFYAVMLNNWSSIIRISRWVEGQVLWFDSGHFPPPLSSLFQSTMRSFFSDPLLSLNNRLAI
jgi:hypothetical protein